MENHARKAAGPAGYWLVLGLIVFVGMTAVIKIEATRTRLLLVVVVLGAALGAASLVERLFQNSAPTDIRPLWSLHPGRPLLYHRSHHGPYTYVVLPRPS
jgi:hypothetical protein